MRDGSLRGLRVLLRGLWLVGLAAICLVGTGCRQWSHKKPDPTKGAVTGIVICEDTGKPARFANVVLTRAPEKDVRFNVSEALPAAELTVSDLDGRFRLEAVEPGRYYAYAVLDGYLDPAKSIDIKQVLAMPDEKSRATEAIRQWKDHLIDVTVGVNRVAELTIPIERGAELRGAVRYDDGSPAIGMRFQVARKRAQGDLSGSVGSLSEPWSIDVSSDGHGRFSLTDLPAGEYTVCALMPAETDEAAPMVCLGDVFRRRNAKTVKVAAGEVLDGVDITIPLSGLVTVDGSVNVLADGHVPGAATLHLLYADDRQEARSAPMQEDGSFSFPYVPEDKYILRVTGALDHAGKHGGKDHAYADMEIPVAVKDGMDDVRVQLSNAGAAVQNQ